MRMRLRKPEVFEDIGYTPHRGQLLVHQSKARFRTLACGTRWGKSTCAAMEAVAALLEPRERSVGWLVAPTYDVCRRIYERLCMVVTQHLRHRVVTISPREQKIVITNLGGGTSELHCKSADHPVSLLGEALDFVIVDEAAQLRDEVWQEHLAPRLIDREGWALVISTPQGPGWFFEMYRRGRRNRDPECESWASPSRDNPHVSAAVIESERGRMPAEKFRQQYEAEFLDVPLDPCEQCGGPQEDVEGRLISPEGEYNHAPPTCPACGMFVDAEGKCIVKKVNEWYASFDVEQPWSDPTAVLCYRWHSIKADGQWK